MSGQSQSFIINIIRTAKMLVKCPVLSRAPLPVRTRPCDWMVHVLVHDLCILFYSCPMRHYILLTVPFSSVLPIARQTDAVQAQTA